MSNKDRYIKKMKSGLFSISPRNVDIKIFDTITDNKDILKEYGQKVKSLRYKVHSSIITNHTGDDNKAPNSPTQEESSEKNSQNINSSIGILLRVPAVSFKKCSQERLDRNFNRGQFNEPPIN